jgi:hypothetical protein
MIEDVVFFVVENQTYSIAKKMLARFPHSYLHRLALRNLRTHHIVDMITKVPGGQLLFPHILQIYDFGLLRVLEIIKEETVVEPAIFLRPLIKRFQKEVAFFFEGLDMNSEKSVAYVVGGHPDVDLPMERLVSSSSGIGWETLVDASVGAQACVIQDQIYLLGGVTGQVQRFDGTKMHTLEPLRYAGKILPLENMSCAVVGSAIYMFGGRLLNTALTSEWATRSMANRYVYRYIPPAPLENINLPKDLWNIVHEYSGPLDNVERVNALNNVGGVFRYDPDSFDVLNTVRDFKEYLYRNALAQNSRVINKFDNNVKLCARGAFIYIFGEDGLRKFDTRGETSWSSDLSIDNDVDMTWNKTRNPCYCQRLSTSKSPLSGNYMDYVIGGDMDHGFSIEKRRNGYGAVWELVCDYTKSREGFAACIMEGQLYVVGGKDCDGQIFHYYMGDMIDATPLRVKGTIIDVYDHCCAAVGSVMYIFGGRLQESDRMNPHVYRYDYREKKTTIVNSYYSDIRGGIYRFAFEDRMNTNLQEERSMLKYRAWTLKAREAALSQLSGDYVARRQLRNYNQDKFDLHRAISLKKFENDGQEMVEEFESSLFCKRGNSQNETALARTHRHCIYLFDRETGDVLSKFDTMTNTWSRDFYPLVTLGGKRNYYSRILFEDDYGYVFDGDSENVKPSFGTYEPDLPREPDHIGEDGLNGDISGVHNVRNKIFVVGGGVDGNIIRKYLSSGHKNEFLVHDGDLVDGRKLHRAASFVMDNHLFIAGGERRGGDSTTKRSYDLDTGTSVLSYNLDTIETQWDKGPTNETRMAEERTSLFNAVSIIQPKSIIEGFLEFIENKQ